MKKNSIKRIVLIGAGNVATHLAHHIAPLLSIVGIASKDGHSAKLLSTRIGVRWMEHLKEIPPCDLVLICSSDEAIYDIEKLLPAHLKVAYTSGSIELKHKNKRKNLGVFYPLQTFSKDSEVRMSEVPFFIEGSNEAFAKELHDLAALLSDTVSYANSDERKKLHLAAVFANNFVNHIAYISTQFLKENQLNEAYITPLLKETMRKISTSAPLDVQTGPARRRDNKIIEAHLSMLEGTPKRIYALLSESIQKTYSKNQD
jgi:predicted short-subunit dehydrogenase-like oxidoreductase (DUF2520 family)